MRRRWLILVILVAILLAGCGRQRYRAGRSRNSQVAPAATQAVEETAAPEAAQGAPASTSDALAGNLDKTLGELEATLSAVDTLEDVE